MIHKIEELETLLHDANTALDISKIMLEKAERQRDNLLARIHRDGGHYVTLHGLEKACADADLIVANLHGISDDKKSLHIYMPECSGPIYCGCSDTGAKGAPIPDGTKDGT